MEETCEPPFGEPKRGSEGPCPRRAGTAPTLGRQGPSPGGGGSPRPCATVDTTCPLRASLQPPGTPEQLLQLTPFSAPVRGEEAEARGE